MACNLLRYSSLAIDVHGPNLENAEYQAVLYLASHGHFKDLPTRICIEREVHSSTRHCASIPKLPLPRLFPPTPPIHPPIIPPQPQTSPRHKKQQRRIRPMPRRIPPLLLISLVDPHAHDLARRTERDVQRDGQARRGGGVHVGRQPPKQRRDAGEGAASRDDEAAVAVDVGVWWEDGGGQEPDGADGGEEGGVEGAAGRDSCG